MLSKKRDKFSVPSLNCQSINAKFDQLLAFLKVLKENKIEFSAICLQETWLGENSKSLSYIIDNYNCIRQNKYCSGLMIFLHKNFFLGGIIY